MILLSLQRVTISASLLLNPFSNQTSKISSSKKASLTIPLSPPQSTMCICALKITVQLPHPAVRPLRQGQICLPVAPFPEKPAQNKWVDE